MGSDPTTGFTATTGLAGAVLAGVGAVVDLAAGAVVDLAAGTVVDLAAGAAVGVVLVVARSPSRLKDKQTQFDDGAT